MLLHVTPWHLILWLPLLISSISSIFQPTASLFYQLTYLHYQKYHFPSIYQTVFNTSSIIDNNHLLFSLWTTLKYLPCAKHWQHRLGKLPWHDINKYHHPSLLWITQKYLPHVKHLQQRLGNAAFSQEQVRRIINHHTG